MFEKFFVSLAAVGIVSVIVGALAQSQFDEANMRPPCPPHASAQEPLTLLQVESPTFRNAPVADPEIDPFGIQYVTDQCRRTLAVGGRSCAAAPDILGPMAATFRAEGWEVEMSPSGGGGPDSIHLGRGQVDQ